MSNGKSVTIVLDVETLGVCDEAMAEAVIEMAARRKDADPDAFVALCPPMARVVCVGLFHVEADKAIAYVDGSLFPGRDALCRSEAGVLTSVNQALSKADRIVTFNGRSFDLPVLVHRSLVHELSPSPKVVAGAREYRYRPNLHVDLVDQFTFFGAGGRYPLRAYCLAYGVDDPKAEVGGGDVVELVRAGDPDALADYCLGDVRAAAELYRRWLDAVGVA